MVQPRFRGRTVLLALLAATAPLLGACFAVPPGEEAPSCLGPVRAASRECAQEVAVLVNALAPRVEAAVPDAHLEQLEVWVQATPTLYAFGSSAYSDADGFWAEGVRRIHLRERADQADRTLAHELVHAGLGPVWRALPGTLEEGLCDHVAARLCPDAAPRLRAGRLASAALALGGLAFDLELWLPAEARPDGVAVTSLTRLRLLADPPLLMAPEDVFVVQAGLSTTHAQPGAKKALYGLGFLVVERIVARIGLDGLHGLCAEARAQDSDHASPERLRAAAGLDGGPEAWSRALAEAFGPAEVREVLRMHPQLLARAVAQLLEPLVSEDGDPALALGTLARVRGRVAVAGNPAGALGLESLGGLRLQLAAEFERRAAAGAR
jgi:hypothetical protein